VVALDDAGRQVYAAAIEYQAAYGERYGLTAAVKEYAGDVVRQPTIMVRAQSVNGAAPRVPHFNAAPTTIPLVRSSCARWMISFSAWRQMASHSTPWRRCQAVRSSTVRHTGQLARGIVCAMLRRPPPSTRRCAVRPLQLTG